MNHAMSVALGLLALSGCNRMPDITCFELSNDWIIVRAAADIPDGLGILETTDRLAVQKGGGGGSSDRMYFVEGDVPYFTLGGGPNGVRYEGKWHGRTFAGPKVTLLFDQDLVEMTAINHEAGRVDVSAYRCAQAP